MASGRANAEGTRGGANGGALERFMEALERAREGRISIEEFSARAREGRNALAGDAEGTRVALERGTPGRLVEALGTVARVKDGSWGGTSEDYAKGMIFTLQTLINAGMDDSRWLNEAWESKAMMETLASVASTRGVRAARAHGLTCLFVDMYVKDDVTRIAALASDAASAFWRLILIASADENEPEGVGGGAKLLGLICTVCCENVGFPKIFFNLSPNGSKLAAMSESKLRARLAALAEETIDVEALHVSTLLRYAPEQATLLHCIAMLMGDKEATSYVDIPRTQIVPGEQAPLLMPEVALAFLVQTTSLVAARFAATEDENERNCALSVLMECISILRAVSEREVQPHAGDTVDCLRREGLVRLVLSLLAALPPPEGIGQTSKATGPASAPKLEAIVPEQLQSGIAYPNKVPWAGYRVDLIAILGNACFNRQSVCEDIVALGGVPIVLNHTRGHDDEPYLREWTLWTVRNMTNGSDEVRKKIMELQPQAVEQSDELLARGLGVELNNESGKPRVFRQKREESSDGCVTSPITRRNDCEEVAEDDRVDMAIPSNWSVTEL